MLRINMLGKAAIYYDQECISDKLSSKLVALVCLLALNKNRDMSKEKIISYLWPDSDEEAAKSNLRFNLWSIKKAIPPDDGEDFIIVGKDFCRINDRYHYECDKTMLDGFKISQMSRVEDLLKLKELFQGDFLEGLYLKNCNELNEMILFERVVCQNRQVEILEKLVGLYEEQERFEEELQILNEVAAIEPYNEQFASLKTIKIYGKLGNRTAAINYYKNFEIVLRRNLNTSPNSELKQLYLDLMESSGSCKYEQKSKFSYIRRKLEIRIQSLPGIEYYGLARIVEEILRSADKQYIMELDAYCLADLNYIYSGFQGMSASLGNNDILSGTAGAVPAVRIVAAFQKLICHVSKRHDIKISILGFDHLDAISRNVILHLESNEIKETGLVIEKN